MTNGATFEMTNGARFEMTRKRETRKRDYVARRNSSIAFCARLAFSCLRIFLGAFR